VAGTVAADVVPLASATTSAPDMPAAVRHAFLQGARSMNGLRYSVELSPVAEGAAEGTKLPWLDVPHMI
jgi:hypothetical protein